MCYFCFVKKFLSNTLQRSNCPKYSKYYLSKRLDGAMSRWSVSYIRHRLHIAEGYTLQATSTRE